MRSLVIREEGEGEDEDEEAVSEAEGKISPPNSSLTHHRFLHHPHPLLNSIDTR
jgi:hypothetical protein